MLELRNGRRNHVAALLARTARFGLRLRQALALNHGVAEHDDGARHCSDLVAGMRGWYAGGGVTVGKTLHDRGKTIERPRDASADQPAESKAKCDHSDADRDNAGARARLRCRKPLRGVASGIARVLDDFVRARQHALTVDVNNCAQWAHTVVSLDPFFKGVDVVFHLLFEQGLHLRSTVDPAKGVGKLLV